MADDKAFTSTPDSVTGNPVGITTVTNAAAQIVDQQVIVIGDPIDGTLHAGVSASGLAVQTGTVTVQGTVQVTGTTVTQGSAWVVNANQGAVGTTAWLIGQATAANLNALVAQGAVGSTAWLVGGAVTVTGTANVALSTGTATIGTVTVTQATAANLNALVAQGAVGSTAWLFAGAVTVTGTATVVLATGAATVGSVALVTGAAVIGALTANQSVTVANTVADNITQMGGIAVTAVTVGVQGVQAVPTQPLRDSGRSYRTFTVVSVTAVTTEALLTMNINSSGTVTTGTTYTVTSGKRLRLQAANLSVIDQSATAVGIAARITIRVAGTVTVASAALLHLQTGTPGITAASVNNGGGAGADLAIPDGIEIPASQQLGISHLGTGITGEITASVVGYEY